MKKNCITIALLIIAATLAACAATPPVYPNLVWPEPPDEPKVKYLGYYKSSFDFPKTGGERLKEILFGVEAVSVSLLKPYAIATDSLGRIYVAETGLRSVVFIDPENRVFEKLKTDPPATFISLVGIVIDDDDNLYASDSLAKRVYIFDKNRKLRKTLGLGDEFTSPTGLALDRKLKRLLVVDSRRHVVKVFDLEGKLLFKIGEESKEGTGSSDEGKFFVPTNAAVDSKGNIYVVDTLNSRVQVFSPQGAFIRVIGSAGVEFGNFVRPKGVAVDSEDHIYVVDAAFNNFQVFSPEGHLLTFVGRVGLTHGTFVSPAGIYIDKDDKIYVTNQMDFARVQIFQYMGEKYKAKAK